ncbi:MAG TPA: lipoate--protein ligase family protein [Candidatus Hydrogenedentes bacterium]|nr:lipoate--protein ligase family protein [Candidatus Hydrogenedentota bacterium]
MRLLDISYTEPAKNLAMDEVILESVEQGRAPDTLRLWESPVPFVVIGSGQRYRQVVDYFNCMRDNMPILRRCSAGGAVLQGPGCLNFALALRYATNPEVADLHGSYEYILEKMATAFSKAGIVAVRSGISDLTVGDLKVSGNAQRRKRNACLHHGTLVYGMKHDVMTRYLPEPEDRPDYRGTRTHSEFVGTLPLSPEALRELVWEAFAPGATPDKLVPEETKAVDYLALTKYARPDWTLRR